MSCMIDLKDLRDNPDKYRQGAAAKRIGVEIERLLELDDKLRSALREREELTAEQNRIGKEIGALVGKLKKADGPEKAQLQQQMSALQQRPNAIKARVQELTKVEQELTPGRDELWLQVPQPPDEDVPRGQSSEDNIETRRWSPGGLD